MASLKRNPGLLVLVIVLASGCGGDGIPRVPVAGRVTLDGEPIAIADISFVALPEDVVSARPQCMGRIQNGSFEIPMSRGPVPGAQLARIVLLKEVNAEPDPSSEIQNTGTRLQELNSISVPIDIPKGGSKELVIDINSKDLPKKGLPSGV